MTDWDSVAKLEPCPYQDLKSKQNPTITSINVPSKGANDDLMIGEHSDTSNGTQMAQGLIHLGVNNPNIWMQSNEAADESPSLPFHEPPPFFGPSFPQPSLPLHLSLPAPSSSMAMDPSPDVTCYVSLRVSKEEIEKEREDWAVKDREEEIKEASLDVIN
mmetsp:Transcript_2703/g.4203  ORF Transcript_2703/g.4203 Transcript_2703/m.4203 type:complete len:160 (+) Transcript_2703:684-1163(+)